MNLHCQRLLRKFVIIFEITCLRSVQLLYPSANLVHYFLRYASLHYAPLRHSFTAVSFSLPADMFVLACAPPAALRAFTGTISTLMQACHVNTLHCVSILSTPASGTRQPIPFLRHFIVFSGSQRLDKILSPLDDLNLT